MFKTFKIINLFTIVLLFSACDKDGSSNFNTPKTINKDFQMSGFVLGDTIEQYFDGVKMREYYGQVRLKNTESQLAFLKDQINMELKRKSNGETIYRQTFNINDKENIVPKFYFDGSKMIPSFSYPNPQQNEYNVNFYVSPAPGSGQVDINIDVLEYLMDEKNKVVVLKTTSFPIMEGIKPGQWTPYVKIPFPEVYPERGGEIYPIVVIRDSKTKQYYINNDRDQSTIQMELPYDVVNSGNVQSMFVRKGAGAGNMFYMETANLVAVFPR